MRKKISIMGKETAIEESGKAIKSLLYLEDDFMDFVHRIKDVRKEYRELYRLVYDQRAFCEIYHEDLPRMKKEITNLLNDSTTSTSVREVLKKLLSITETAISENKHIFAEPDYV